MTHEEKINELAQIFQTDASALKSDTVLDTLNWDSMARVALIGVIKEKFGKAPAVDCLRKAKTIGDILAVMEE